MAEKVRELATAIEQASERAGKYLTFRLGPEEYGLEILKVKEIIGVMDITAVPRTPHFIKGVINLRGKVIPVMELRAKFGMETIEYTEQTCIIVVEFALNSGTVQMGILVDSVSEVLDINADDIEETPAFGGDFDAEFILGMAKTKGSVKILLNIEKVLSAADIVAIPGVSSQGNVDKGNNES
ncbi:MAG: chemotaxis protein CheW [Planctomycetota bacterium]|jgi:purine-binding chemotaxis protein CheW